MPFTPYHLGPAILIGLILFPLLDLPTFVIANVVIDLEPMLVIILGLGLPLHGPFHSLTLGSFAATALALAMYGFRGLLTPFFRLLKLQQTSRFNQVLASSLLGVWFHVVLDAFLYPKVMLLYPLDGNPLMGLASPSTVYGLCTAAFPLALLVYLFRFIVPRRGGGG